MVIEVEFLIPAPLSGHFRQMVLANVPKDGKNHCPRCGADRFHVLDALCDTKCWQNRGMAIAILRGCDECKRTVKEALSRVRDGLLPSRSVDGDPSTQREVAAIGMRQNVG
jgi:hypothetical protein